VRPARTPSGYRQFSTADVERLRFILTAQRDHYLPLKVIREQLAAMDRGVAPGPHPGPIPPLAAVDMAAQVGLSPEGSSGDEPPMSREELLARAGIDQELLTELEQYGLVRSGPDGFDTTALQVARTVKVMTGYGIEPRHLRAFRTAADREVGLLAQIVMPLARQRDPEARERAVSVAEELAGLAGTLHAMLVRAGMHDVLDGS